MEVFLSCLNLARFEKKKFLSTLGGGGVRGRVIFNYLKWLRGNGCGFIKLFDLV